jgi:putative membrane-bound dehydrogenase-like protein
MLESRQYTSEVLQSHHPMPLARTASLLLALCSLTALHAAEPSPIFDGQSLTGWEGHPEHWRVADGAITGEIPAGETLRANQFIFWKDDVHDFELTLEYRISGVPSANSGIQFRSQRSDGSGAAGYQADLDDGQTWLGRIYDEHGRALITERGTHVSIAPNGRRWADPFAPAESFRMLPKRDDWNIYRVKSTGPHVEVWVNGALCSTLDDHEIGAAEYSGRLAFQLHSGPGPAKVQFRNVRLAHLGRTEFPKSVATPADSNNRQSQSPVLWHLRLNPAKPTPVDNAQAQAVVAGMQLMDGFQAELIAAEPDVHQPIAFAIDERGRLWIAEAFSYPNRQPEGQGKDRIRILEDADGDGQFETRKTFTEGLNLVSGIEVGFGGVWIGAAPELLFIPDRDRDDQPDGPPQVLLDGFGYQDTHETLNSFTWGPDGWLYGNQGVFNTALIGKPGSTEAERTPLRAGVWRYHPTRHVFEIFAHGGSNQWGLDFNDAGHLFMTHCRSYWGGGGVTYVIRNGHFWNQTNSNYASFVSNAAPDEFRHLRNFLPASARYDNGEGGAGKPGTTAVYGGHSPVGTMIYLGDNWPAIYRDHLFNHNLHGHQMNHVVNVRHGSAYESLHAGYDLTYAPDPAYIPVDLQYGPDGAVYVIDWVDRQHCHNPRGEIWDRTNGRVYRISWGATYKPVRVDLGSKTDAELVALESHPNRWYGRTARRLLQERTASVRLEPQLVNQLCEHVAAVEPQTALAALWTLHVTNSLQRGQFDAALHHADDVVREWAIRLATEKPGQPAVPAETLVALAGSDPSPMVRLSLASALPALPAEECWRVGSALAAHGEEAGDRFLPGMIWYGLATVVESDVPHAMQLAQSTPLASLTDSIHWYLSRRPAGRDALSQRIAGTADDTAAARLLSLLRFGLQYDSRLTRPKDWSKVQQRFATGSLQRACDELSAVFGDEAVLAAMRSRLADDAAPVAARLDALSILRRVGDNQAGESYIRLLDNPKLRPQLIPLLARTPGDAAARKLLDQYNALDEAERTAALGVLTSRADFALALLHAVDSRQFDKQHLTALQIRQMHNLGNADVNRLLEKVWGRVGGSSEEMRAMIARLRNTYTTAPLWAYSEDRGRALYQKTCAACHPLDGSTVPLGPGLAAAWRNGLDYFLENVVDPNAVVGENYRLTLIVTTSGTIVSGLLDSETDTAVVLRTAEKPVTVPKSEIEERKLVNESLMPTGLLDKLSETETIELLKFLTSKR